MTHRRQIGFKLGGVDRTRQSRQLHIQKRRRFHTWANKYHPRALSHCAIQIIIIAIRSQLFSRSRNREKSLINHLSNLYYN